MSGSSKITPTQLRANIYEYLDQVLESGEPLEIVRKGRVLRISLEEPLRPLSRLEPHPDYLEGDPEDLVHLDWSDTWAP